MDILKQRVKEAIEMYRKLNRKNSKATCEKVQLRFIVHICYKNKVF